MRLDDYDKDIKVRDKGRGSSGFGGGGGMLALLVNFLPFLLRRKLGWGTILLIGAGAFFLYNSGGLGFLSGSSGEQTATAGSSNPDEVCTLDATRKEVCDTFSSVNNTWERLFQQNNSRYQEPTLNFFTDRNSSACGAAQAAMGPFYCPADKGVYLDTSFFGDLERRMGAGGDFARSYVIAHEVGHHIQTITGVSDQVRSQQARSSKANGNALQVRMELQADCYAGVWAGLNANRIEQGDIEEGMRAANAIGDDNIMKSAGRRPVPESFTHGTSQQRMRWLRKGIQTRDPSACDTFSTNQL